MIESHEAEDLAQQNGADINSWVSYAPDPEISSAPQQQLIRQLHPQGEEMIQALDMYSSNLRTNLHLFQLSCALKHVEALRLISEMPSGEGRSDDQVFGLVVEDDVEFQSDTLLLKLLHITGRMVREKVGMCFVGIPVQVQQQQPLTDLAMVDFWSAFKFFPPSTESYVVSKAFAKALCRAIMPIRYMWHVHLGYTLKKLEILGLLPSEAGRVAVSIPNVFLDGSKAGSCTSSVLPHNPLVYNHEYNRISDIVCKYEQRGKNDGAGDEERNADAKTCLDTWSASKVAGHPSMLHMKGKVHLVIERDHGKARDVFQAAYKDVVEQGGIINNETLLLRDYIKSFQPCPFGLERT